MVLDFILLDLFILLDFKYCICHQSKGGFFCKNSVCCTLWCKSTASSL